MSACVLHVCVAAVTADGTIFLKPVALPEGATVKDALAKSGIFLQHPGLYQNHEYIGIYGGHCALDTRVKTGDRIEVYRPRRVDPKAKRLKRLNNNSLEN